MATPQLVTFEWPYGGSEVFLSGSFNRWSSLALLKKKNTSSSVSSFSTTVELVPGLYYYKFIVDGVWCHNGQNPTVDDDHGGLNNVVVVSAGSQVPKVVDKKVGGEEKRPVEGNKDKKVESKKKEKGEKKVVKVLSEEERKLLGTFPSGEVKRGALEELLKQRFFYVPAYEIYGGVKGLYDYGPNGSAVCSNLEKFWREFFILEENMLQIQTATLTPEIVFKTSGHVDKFEDLMVSDKETGECFRADHLLEDALESLLSSGTLSDSEIIEVKNALTHTDDFNAHELGAQLKKYKVVAPLTGNEISDPFPFNLMFSTQIGPTGKFKGYLRPETAQGMFVNFNRLLSFNADQLPFAAAQIGPAFRNEISPRSGLLRVREFTLAEIEHFVDPKNKDHPKFSEVADQVLPLLCRESQEALAPIQYLSIGTAVTEGIVNNETLGYFLVRVYLFLTRIGINENLIRFRQHLNNEMAHYATDCWDAEIFTTYGWIECVGNADRACFDLTAHQKASGKNMSAFILFPDGPRFADILEPEIDKGTIGRTYKAAAKNALSYLESIKEDQDALSLLYERLTNEGRVEIEGITLTPDTLSFKKETKKITGASITPSVIEPSFGLGRIIYCLLEHSHYVRPGHDEALRVLRLRPLIAPYKTSIFPLVSNDKMLALVPRIVNLLTRHKISYKVDTTGVSIGRRYARTDEIGIPFAITIDAESVEKGDVTVRERDSTHQVRVPLDVLGEVIRSLVDEELTWNDIENKFPKVLSNSE